MLDSLSMIHWGDLRGPAYLVLRGRRLAEVPSVVDALACLLAGLLASWLAGLLACLPPSFFPLSLCPSFLLPFVLCSFVPSSSSPSFRPFFPPSIRSRQSAQMTSCSSHNHVCRRKLAGAKQARRRTARERRVQVQPRFTGLKPPGQDRMCEGLSAAVGGGGPWRQGEEWKVGEGECGLLVVGGRNWAAWWAAPVGEAAKAACRVRHQPRPKPGCMGHGGSEPVSDRSADDLGSQRFAARGASLSAMQAASFWPGNLRQIYI